MTAPGENPTGYRRELRDLLVGLRHERGDPSLRGIAVKAGLAHSYVGDVLHRGRLPTPAVAVRIAAALGATEEQRRAAHRYAEGAAADVHEVKNLVRTPSRKVAPAGRAAEAAVSWPHLIGTIAPLADCRQRRPADDDLTAAVTTGGTAVVCHVLAGMGGVGKTQLTAALAHRLWHDRQIDLAVWVTASSRESIVSSYARAGSEVLGVPESQIGQAADRFLSWLAEPHGRRWLIVLDDLENPEDLVGLWPPAVPTGRTVVTTRRQDAALAGHGRKIVEVGLFTHDESVRYLTAKLNGDQQRLCGAHELADLLGNLPLAMAQAGAYINDRALSCDDYITRFAGERRRLGDVLPECTALPDGHRATIAVTWSLSIDAADSLSPAGLSRPALELASLFDSNGIPEAIFRAPAAVQFAGGFRDDPTSADDARDALFCLQRLSLVNFDRTSGMVRVHELVQRSVREMMSESHAASLAWVAADALIAIWPDTETDPAVGQMLRDHMAALRKHAGAYLWNAEQGAHQVLFTAGNSLDPSGHAAAAVDYYRVLTADLRSGLGERHPDTLTATNNWAWALGRAGNAGSALSMLQDIYATRRAVSGPEHVNTLAARHGIAVWQGIAGDHDGAVATLRELLQDYVRVLGPDHRDTLNTRRSLLDRTSEKAKPAETIAELSELVRDYQRALGHDHPETLELRANIATRHGRAGDATGAVKALEELLADCLRTLGPKSLQTSQTRHYLYNWQGLAGDAFGAMSQLVDLLAEYIETLGAEHEDTRRVRRDIRYWKKEIEVRRREARRRKRRQPD